MNHRCRSISPGNNRDFKVSGIKQGFTQGIGQAYQGFRSLVLNRVDLMPRPWDKCITYEKANTHRTNQVENNGEAVGATGYASSEDYERRKAWADHYREKQSFTLRPQHWSASDRSRTSIATRTFQEMIRIYETSKRPQLMLEPLTCPALVCGENKGTFTSRQAIPEQIGRITSNLTDLSTGLHRGKCRALGK